MTATCQYDIGLIRALSSSDLPDFFLKRAEWPKKVVIMLQEDLVMTATCRYGDHVDMGVFLL